MGKLRHWLRRIEKGAKEEVFRIPMPDGSVKEFAKKDLTAAYLNIYERAISGPDDAPEMHHMVRAMLESPDPEWRACFSDLLDGEHVEERTEDLSVQVSDT